MLERLAIPIVAELVVLIELMGVAIITMGAAWTLGRFLLALARREDTTQSVACFRSNLGRAILVGLEFLVIADIINTVVIDLSLENIAGLAGIVAVRIILSFSLEVEIEGRWPWQRAGGEQRNM